MTRHGSEPEADPDTPIETPFNCERCGGRITALQGESEHSTLFGCEKCGRSIGTVTLIPGEPPAPTCTIRSRTHAPLSPRRDR